MPIVIPSRDSLINPINLADTLYGASGVASGVLCFPFDFNMADANVLYTAPAAAQRLHIFDAFWEPTTSFTGGASSAIGLSSSNAGYATKGDLLGGAAGDVAAGLTATAATPLKRTAGTKVASPGVVLLPGNTIRFDRITSAFTQGAGLIHVCYRFIPYG
jgi:hypothetical protein